MWATSLCPLISKIWNLKSKTPLIHHSFNAINEMIYMYVSKSNKFWSKAFLLNLCPCGFRQTRKNKHTHARTHSHTCTNSHSNSVKCQKLVLGGDKQTRHLPLCCVSDIFFSFLRYAKLDSTYLCTTWMHKFINVWFCSCELFETKNVLQKCHHQMETDSVRIRCWQ